MSALEALKVDFRSDILSDRRMWLWMVIPQLLLFLFLALLIALISAYGLYSAVAGLKAPVVDFKSISSIIVGSSSGAGSLSLFKIFAKINDLTLHIISHQRRYTGDLNLIKQVSTEGQLQKLTESYKK